MMENDWVCHDDILINVDPNGDNHPGLLREEPGHG